MPISRILDSLSPPSREPGTVLVETERLIIRRMQPSDAPALAEALNDSSVVASLSDRFPSPYTLADAEKEITSNYGEDVQPYPATSGIFVKPNTPDNPAPQPVFIGNVGVHARKDVSYRTWDLGYFLMPSAWGRGYATEAVGAVVRFAFETWPKLNRIEARTYDFNQGSRRVLLKIGFKEEGRAREAIEKDGKICDRLIFGLIRSDLA